MVRGILPSLRKPHRYDSSVGLRPAVLAHGAAILDLLGDVMFYILYNPPFPSCLQTPEARVSLNYEPPHSQALGAPATAGSDFKLSLFIVGGSAPRRALLDELLAPLLPALNVSWVVALTPADLTYGPGFLARHAETNKTLACLMSHVEAARALLNSGAQVGLIAEDDVRFHRHAMGRLEALVAWQAAHPDVPMVQVRLMPKEARRRCLDRLQCIAGRVPPVGRLSQRLSLAQAAADHVAGAPAATLRCCRVSPFARGRR